MDTADRGNVCYQIPNVDQIRSSLLKNVRRLVPEDQVESITSKLESCTCICDDMHQDWRLDVDDLRGVIGFLEDRWLPSHLKTELRVRDFPEGEFGYIISIENFHRLLGMRLSAKAAA